MLTVSGPGAAERLDPYGERILEAARELLIEHGLRRTTLADIARAAGVSDATLYRRFAGRDVLLARLVDREARQFIARVDEAIATIASPHDALVEAFLIFVRTLRGHELVQRLLVTDPELILPLLSTGGAPALRLAREYILQQARRAQALGAPLRADPEHLAEILVRLAHSLLLTPETALPLDDEPRLAELARRALVPMVFLPEEERA